MKKRKALSVKNRARGLHLQSAAVAWLLLDRFNPSGWVWGMVGTFFALVLIVDLIDFFNTEEIEFPAET